jgi:hypothetical protein
MICTSLLFPTVVVSVVALLNSIAIYYDSVNAIPVLVIVKMVAVWIFVSFPLNMVGTIFGRHFVSKDNTPCTVHSIPRYTYIDNTHPILSYPILYSLFSPLSSFLFSSSLLLSHLSLLCSVVCFP